MSRPLALALLCLVAFMPLDTQAQTVPRGTIALWHQHHAVFPNGMVDTRSGWTYSFPVTLPSRRHSVKTVHRTSHRNAPHSRQKSANHAPVQRPRGGYWVRVFTTGYDDTGYTASGLLAGYGRVAVDPRVFPLGTRFYISGYGYAVAADTGGAVIGYRVDLWFSTVSQCYANTGWRMIEVLS